MTKYTDTDRAFIEQMIIELYDAEVAKHPEGISFEAAKEAIRPAVKRLVASIDPIG